MLVMSLLREETLEEEKFWGRKKMGFSDSSVYKESTCNAGDIRDADSIPGLGRSPGGGHGNPLQCSCLDNPMVRGAWQATVHLEKSPAGPLYFKLLMSPSIQFNLEPG